MSEQNDQAKSDFVFDDHAAADTVDLSPSLGDEMKTTTCYMCACRCGIRVYLKNGQVRYIQGNPDHPINKGVLCGKGSSGIMQHYSPARLSKPLKRVGERGSGEFEEIEWEEALEIATSRLKKIREDDPKKLAFFTGRDQSQATTGWWASMFGTPNYAAHGGFCSVNMAAAGLYSIGGAFWEFGEPDWKHSKYFMMFGVAEDHDSNPIKKGLATLKENGAKFVSVNPIRTGYSAIADEWVGIRPGTDGLFIMAIMHELLKAGKVDQQYLKSYTNAAWMVIQDEDADDHGMFYRDADGDALVWSTKDDAFAKTNDMDATPAMSGTYTLPDGRTGVPSFQIMAERYMSDEYAPDNIAEQCGLKAEDIKRVAAEMAHVAFEEQIELDIKWVDWAGRKQEKMIGRPVSFHAMRGISAHSNGFHTCRAIHLLQMLLGAIECPGGFRIKAPFPKPIPPSNKPTGKADHVAAGSHLPGMALGFPTSPEDMLLDDDGKAVRIDKAYSWDFPLASHGLMHMVIHNAWAQDPYKIDTLMLFMANMAWNSSMNTSKVLDMLTDKEEDGSYKIPNIIYSDAYYSEMVAYADLVLPDTTYLERFDAISMLDRPVSSAHHAGDAIRHPVVEPDRDVRGFQGVLLDLGARLGLPGMVNVDGSPKYPGGYEDYIVNHERQPGVGLLAGWRGIDEDGDHVACKGPVNPDQLEMYKANGSFWKHDFLPEHTYYKMANQGYLEWAHDMGCVTSKEQIVFNLYSEILQSFKLAGQGKGKVVAPATHAKRVAKYFDPLPIWYQPLEESMTDLDEYPLHALTQRPMHMYHSWGSQNAWLRQITNKNRMYINRETAKKYGLVDDDWAWVTSPHGKIRV